ncbi:DUF1631 family protein [Aquincola sp. S2]|uniref:DUF1631 family protein n=1 Tax=Pseudaquabacterium terrae TaxID=2732868 RepID=A0ABX2EKF0_9BURK|nr:DUF1631 family protein [Aquabacterium terrae]NRF69108.1 DUF1631 family protein [Aquabacterium terrae]
MTLTAPARLPAALESAVQRVRMAARSAAERTVDSLGLAALSSNNVFHRDGLLGAQFELNRKLAIFALTFNETLDQRVAREAGMLNTQGGAPQTNWDALSLVTDHEVEIQVSADRFALEISHACEWEIRELDAYMGTLLKFGRADHERNPLRAEVIGQAMIRAVEAVAERPETRKVLGAEIGRSLANLMRPTYAEIVADLRAAGIKPVGLQVRQTPHDAAGRATTGPGSLHGELHDSRAHELSASGRLSARGPAGFAPSTGGGGFPRGAFGSGGGGHGGAGGRGTPMGRVDAEMMSLLRRLSFSTATADSGSSGVSGFGSGPAGGSGFDGGGAASGLGMLMAPNLIVAHREELRQAATGALDHMVIDVIASLFDQILSDPKVPPQMARQIARLQLPVLRAALGDPSFFSSRKHPVRRFINRIASLGTAVDDFDGESGRALLARVRELVQEVVEGDFDQMELYEHKLNALEAFIAEQAKAEVHAQGAADELLGKKEEQLRVQQRFAQQLDGALQPLPVPDFLREFLGRTWSRVIAQAEQSDGGDSVLARRMREVGRELVMSVQPKGVPAQRQAFLKLLPQLMKDLNAGLDRMRCPEPVRRDFFAKLLPAHAESLKGQALSTLEHNLLAKQVDGALATPLPKGNELPPVNITALPVLNDVVSSADFSAAEASAVGLVDESAVDWNGAVDIDLGAEPELTTVDLDIAGLPVPESVEPMRGKTLADHVQIGFAYQMHIEDAWQKVKLQHVSAARTFFVFSHGAKQRKTVSMTYRMLSRMCETGRMRAFESAYLLERATARARRQLAQLKPN